MTTVAMFFALACAATVLPVDDFLGWFVLGAGGAIVVAGVSRALDQPTGAWVVPWVVGMILPLWTRIPVRVESLYLLWGAGSLLVVVGVVGTAWRYYSVIVGPVLGTTLGIITGVFVL
jgi:hypothetical protein